VQTQAHFFLVRDDALHRTDITANTPQTIQQTIKVEQQLALELGIPVYGTDPTVPFGTKSGSRTAFRLAGVSLADGAENLYV
jgi:hypothetical protein